jgi:hypothetical protein
MDYASIILNQGLYQMRTIATVPGWIANEGESLLYSSGGVRRVYYYIDGSWKYLQWGGGNSLSLLADSDYDTIIDVEKNTDEDIIRFSTGDTQGGTAGERATMDYLGFYLASGLKLGFEGSAGDTHWKYNSVTYYLEGWVDNIKRIEL